MARAKALGACPVRLADGWADVASANDDGGGDEMKSMSVRLTEEQQAALERLAPVLTRKRPDLAGLAGDGGLTTYSVLRIAIAIGLADLERQAAEGGDHD